MNFNISADDLADFIEGNPKNLGKRVFWKILISSQLDADRGDYLLRDSLHIGVKYGVYDLERLLVSVALGIDPESEDVTLGIREGGRYVAEALIIARYQMFSQVYFHKTRRAFDKMYQEAIVSKSNILPSPEGEELTKFLKLDDYEMWQWLKNSDDNYWCRSIKTRDHIRRIREIRGIPTPEDDEKLSSWMKILDDEGIWYWVDESPRVWYDTNRHEKGNKEIMIVTKDQSTSPLSERSPIVKNIGDVRQIRLYVKPEDRERAEKMV